MEAHQPAAAPGPAAPRRAQRVGQERKLPPYVKNLVNIRSTEWRGDVALSILLTRTVTRHVSSRAVRPKLLSTSHSSPSLLSETNVRLPSVVGARRRPAAT
jgi:hypothetical protein